MAKRPVFIKKDSYPFYETIEVEFEYYSGFAVSQKQKSIRALHLKYKELRGDNVLEISTKSTEELGVRLSAFSLPIKVNDREITLECVFQGSKKFRSGGPYNDLYDVTPWEAKKDPRIKESGNLIGFELEGRSFGNEPKDFFYNWIYIKALCENPEYVNRLEDYTAFTDIEFNPQKSINCQAKAVAIAMGLKEAGLLENCLADERRFLKEVYHVDKLVTYEQMTFTFTDE